jgi:hypothetical protein
MAESSYLQVERKKGDSAVLDGRLTVYALIDVDPSDLADMKHPVASLAHNGLLVAQGNYAEQSSLRDFLKSEMGLSLEEGLEQLLDKLEGLESALDPEKLREKIENMGDMEDFIPTPAKIVPFHSEEEVLAQDGDVYYVGRYRKIGNAMLGVNAFPMLYQARFREQTMEAVRKEIDQLIRQIEQSGEIAERYNSPGIDVTARLLKDFIPNMLYCRKEPPVFETAEKQFRAFMGGYPFDDDVNVIVDIIKFPGDLTSRHYKLLELYAQKIAAMCREDFGKVDDIRRSIGDLDKVE